MPGLSVSRNFACGWRARTDTVCRGLAGINVSNPEAVRGEHRRDGDLKPGQREQACI